MKKIILILILILAFFLRFYKLDSYPALNADEAAIGYNAHSLIQTGMDEHGNKWPIHFQSFNDYKPSLYFYLVLPFVKVLGLNEWAVRIPNAFLGVATIYVLYLLTKKLFNDEKLALISSFLLAISPWHIHFSRGGWEVNTATFLIMSGVLSFLYGLKNSRFYLISSVFFALSLYTYHSARIISPFLGLSLMIIYWKDLNIKNNFKTYILYTIYFILLLVPLIVDFTKSGALSRAKGVGLFADIGPINRINEQRGEHRNLNSPLVKILHNKYMTYGVRFVDNYTKHFSGEFLFMTGDSIQRNKVPETGVLYLFDIILLVCGIWYIAKSNTKENKLIVLWILIAPVASALTFQSPNALRSQNMIIPLTIISALGLNYIFSKKLYTIYYILFTVFIAWCFSRYLYLYYNFMSNEFPFSSQYGVKEMVAYINANESKYKDVVITDRYDQPYILYLFYTKYDPVNFQKNHELTAPDQYGFSTVRDFDKFHFYSIKFDEMKLDYPNSLIIGTPEEIPEASNIVKKIYGSNDYNYFNIVAN